MSSSCVGLPIRSVLVAILCLCAGACTRTVLLGSECPELDTECSPPDPDDEERDAGEAEMDADDEELDAEAESGSVEPDADPLDANGLPIDAPTQRDVEAVIPDANLDDALPPLVPLVLTNPEFQRNPGVPTGDVALTNNLLDPLTLGIVFSDLPGWYACWVGSVNSVTWELDQNVGTPLYKGDYLSLVLNSVFNSKIEPARQKLSAPMRVGVSYALELDALGLPDNGAQLFVEVRGYDSDCGEGTLLARSAALPERRWTPLCLAFTPDRAFSHISIGTGYAGPQPSTNARVRLDSLRQLQVCPVR